MTAKLELADLRAQMLESRLASEATRFAADKEQLDRKVRDLSERFEREKAARVVAASALEALRGRISRSRETTRLHDILARAGEAEIDRGQGRQPRSNTATAAREAGLDAPPREGAVEAPAAAGETFAMPKAHPLIVNQETARGKHPVLNELW